MTNFIHEVKDKVGNTVHETQHQFNNATNTFQKSGNDWLDYIQEHPIQSIFFAASLFYSIKGFFKK